MTGNAPPEFAIIQGGTHPPANRDTSHLRTVASVDLEPVWLIARPDKNVSSLRDLSTLAVAAGDRGSGTVDLFRTLLKASDQQLPGQTYFRSNIRAVRAFLDHRVDFIFSVSPADNPWLDPLIRATEIKFAEVSEAGALTRKFPFLTTLKLPRASLDLARGVPGRDLTILATATNLVSSEAVHTATKMLALQALREIDHGSLLLGTNDQFPNLKYADYPIDPEANRFFASGPPFFRRYLPYWMANLVERFYAFLLPLLTISLPMFRLVPAWIGRHRRELTNRWYAQLAEVEKAVAASSDDEFELQRYSRRLDLLEEELEHHRNQFSRLQEYFALRLHVEQVRRQIWRKLIAGWLETSDPAIADDSKAGNALDIGAYRSLLAEIERDLNHFSDLEARFEKTGIPGELFGDILDVRRGLRKARQHVLMASRKDEGSMKRETKTRTPAAPERPSIKLVSDRIETLGTMPPKKGERS